MKTSGSFFTRMRGLLRKEFLQIVRDPSSILLALVMPVILLFLFGYGVSLNPTQTPVAVMVAERGPLSGDLAARFTLSDYFRPVFVHSLAEAAALMREGSVDGFVALQDDFDTRLLRGERAVVQVVVNGVDANRARLIQGYVSGAVRKWIEVRRSRGETAPLPGATINPRIRFNESGESRNFLIPGLIAVIMTLIGALLTALVIAREWERGTMEAILVTPLRTNELMLGKILPYFTLGMAGMLLSVAGGVFIFDVPLRGSLWLLILLSALFLLASLGFGLMISATVRVQFVAAQISIVAGFLPAFFLSGLLFDLESTPLPIRVISHVIPARYFVTISHTLFLAGDIVTVLWPAAGALALIAALMLIRARGKLSKRLE